MGKRPAPTQTGPVLQGRQRGHQPKKKPPPLARATRARKNSYQKGTT